MTTATATATTLAIVVGLLLAGLLLSWAAYRVIRWLFPGNGGARN